MPDARAALLRYLRWHLEASEMATASMHDLIEQAPFDAQLTRSLREVSEDVAADHRALRHCCRRLGGCVRVEAPSEPTEPSAPEDPERRRDPVRTFIELEQLALTLLARRSVWRALSLLPPADIGGAVQDFAMFEQRAATQFALVEAERLRVAVAALLPSSRPAPRFHAPIEVPDSPGAASGSL